MPAYIKFDGIDGESEKSGAEKYIEIGGFSLDGFAPESSDYGSGQGAIGAPTYSPIPIQCTSGIHSAPLLKKFNEGAHIDNAEILVMKPTGAASTEWFRKFTLTKVYVTAYSQSVQGDGDSGVENITIKFEEIKQEYKRQQPDGSLVAAGDTTYNNKTSLAS